MSFDEGCRSRQSISFASEIFPLMNFSEFGVDARLMRTIEHAGYETPTPIQAQAIPIALEGKDLIGTAQTGTGKTAAFVLPILQRLLNGQNSHHRALIVTPTRELAEQINDTVRALSKGTNIRSAAIYGGVSAVPQERALRDGVEILVATPGRLLDHIGAGRCRLDRIEVLVLDEADRMFDMGFLPQVRRILSHVPKKRQTMLFSATFPREVEALAADELRQPVRIDVGKSKAAHTVAHALYPVPNHLKADFLVALLKHTDAYSMLVFTRTKHRAERLARVLSKQGFMTTSLHSDRSQNQRQSALRGFKDGKYQIMVATDIAARGLDIESVSHVINFDVPDTTEAYIHRIGRTGRAEREGDAFTLITPEDRGMVRDIERALGKPIERRKLEDFDYEAQATEKPQHEAPPQRQQYEPQRAQQPRQQPKPVAVAPREPAAQREPAHAPAQRPAHPSSQQRPSQRPRRPFGRPQRRPAKVR
jgi:ATP-dependent RNA helicase RhlE